MKKIVDVFNAACNITPIKACKQHWTQEKFSYMEKPRPDYGVMLLINGRIDFATHSDTVSAKAGDVIFLPKNSYYEAIFHIELGEVNNYLINFETDDDFCDFTRPERILENISFTCTELFRQFTEENYMLKKTDFRSKGLIYLLFDSIMNDKNSKLNKVVEKAISLLEKSEDIPISQIAHECSVSESGLRKLFKDNTGLSPSKYRLNVKLNKAKYLLESTDMSVGEISDKLNFFDTAYFCKTFCKHVGMSPRKYSKNKKL